MTKEFTDPMLLSYNFEATYYGEAVSHVTNETDQEMMLILAMICDELAQVNNGLILFMMDDLLDEPMESALHLAQYLLHALSKETLMKIVSGYMLYKMSESGNPDAEALIEEFNKL